MAKYPGNSTCCDCSCKRVSWASINLGCFLCYECSGQHRNLGTHISQVRSLTLDRWKPQWLQNMIARLPPGKFQPDEHDQSAREKWIKQKYQEKKWYSNIDSDSQKEALSQAVDTNISRQQSVQSISYSQQQVSSQEQPQQPQQLQQQPQQQIIDPFQDIFGTPQVQQVQVQQQFIQQEQPQQQSIPIQEYQTNQTSQTQQQINDLDDLLGIFGEPTVEQNQKVVQKQRLQFDW